MNQALAPKLHSKTSRYQPDLDEMLSQCELNYLLMQRLSPEFMQQVVQSSDSEEANSHEEWKFEEAHCSIAMKITERAKYTTTLLMWVKSPTNAVSGQIELIVRMYHDAKMLEVMEGTGPGALKAIYELNDAQQRPADEKRQLNRFIGECLKACL
ncbi:MAG: DUF1249 domain-containing protein [Kangiellaceae bacterium]|nr:DUF1249 domain-containing protein [Kangiellaceae bacterium]MCW8999198.1 DUF1249 domain-containing protein [Kangiellaceae bacterium]